MPFKVVVADPESGKSHQLEAREPGARRLVGLRIGEKLDGSVVGLPGYELQITGGTDKDGFAMRPDVGGPRHAYVLLAGPPGYRPTKRGARRRKRVHGSVISEAVVQINAKVVKRGERPIEEILKPKEEKTSPSRL